MKEYLEKVIDAIREAQMNATSEQYSQLDEVMYTIQDIMEA